MDKALMTPRGTVLPREPPGKWAWVWIVPTVFMRLLAISFIIAPLPHLQVAAYGKHLFLVLGASAGVQGLLMFILSPILGRLSDRIGRKWLLFATTLGMSLPGVLFPVTTNMWLYAIMNATFGALQTNLYIAMAYVTDLTPPSRRAFGIGVTVAMLGISLAIGPLAGSMIIKAFDERVLFIVADAVLFINLAYIAFLLPESTQYAKRIRRLSVSVASGDSRKAILGALQAVERDMDSAALLPPVDTEHQVAMVAGEGDTMYSRRTASDDSARLKPRHGQRAASANEHTVVALNVCATFRTLYRTPLLTLLALLLMLASTSEQALITLVLPYMQHRFHATTTQVGLFASLLGAVLTITQGIVFPIALKRVRPTRFLQCCLLASLTHVTIYGFANKLWMCFAAVALAPGAFMVVPVEMQGAMQGVRALTNGIGPLVFGPILNLTVYSGRFPQRWSGCAFFIGSLCVIGALLVSLFLPDFRASTEDELAEAEEKRRVASTSAQHSAPLPAHSRAMSADGGAEVHGSVLASN